MSSSNKDEVKFFIGQTDLSDNLKSFSLRYDMLSGASSFDAELNVRLDIRLSDAPRVFWWRINGQPVMGGYIDRVDRAYSKNDYSLRLSGRDMMQVLIDNYVLKFATYTNIGIKELIRTIFNLSVSVQSLKSGAVKMEKGLYLLPLEFVYTAAAEKKIKDFKYLSIKTNPGETLFNSISKICNQIGLFLYNLPGTDIIFIHAVNSPEDDQIGYDIKGNPTTDYYTISDNALSCDFTEDITRYYKYIKIIGNAQKEEGLSGKIDAILGTSGPQWIKLEKIESISTAKTKITLSDLDLGYQGATKFLVSEVSDIDVNTWKTKGNDIIDNILAQQKRALFSLRYKVPDFSPEGSQAPYFYNRVVSVTDGYLGYKNTKFQLVGVEFNGSKDGGYTTDLTLSVPSTADINTRTGPFK